ncbi:MAG TPA: group III truncated hemoglobin [Steroidobacteraceae bacterium]|nr:group III truncated hemoglobin [Steroidobacteraceae bacterium]
MSADAPAGLARRQALIAEIVGTTGINEEMIRQLVHGFYQRAREDDLIGPIFNARVQDWDLHLARLCDFWSSVTLMSGRYHGQPMVAHAPLPIEPQHFDRWLQLFAQTAREVCPEPAARYFIERACRIADSLELGIAVRRGELRGARVRPPP